MTVLGFLIVLVVLGAIGYFILRRLGGPARLKSNPRYIWVLAAAVVVVGTGLTLLPQAGPDPFFLGLMGGFAVILQPLGVFKGVIPKRQVPAQLIMPPPWPPRQPADWGRDIQLKYQRAVRSYQNSQSTASAFGVRGGGTPPMMPMIPLWEAHYASEQARAPLQIRWAQTDNGDWLQINYGNRMRPPAPGKQTPVFQIMQRQDGQWIWLEIPSQDFSWQRGPARVENFSYTNAEGVQCVASRPCGHPGYQLAPQSEEETGVHGTARALSDAELADMNAMHHSGPIVGPQPGDMPPGPPADGPENAPAPSIHGASRPLSDDDLRRMGASNGPDLNDPSSLGGIL